MTRRLAVIAAAGLVATLAAGGLALSLRGPASPSAVSPSWGLFTDAQWRTVGSRIAALGLDVSDMKVVTAMPRESGAPFAIVSAARGGRTCFVLVRGASPASPICSLSRPLLAFAAPEHDGIDVVGLAGRDVEGVVASSAKGTQGSALLPAAGVHAFGARYMSRRLTLTAHVRGGAVVARLYCASALRAVCGMSAQRRS